LLFVNVNDMSNQQFADIPDKLKLVLFSLAEEVQGEIQPNKCVFELSEDQGKYQLRVIGGNPGIIAWATNDPDWLKLETEDSRRTQNLIINVRGDLVPEKWRNPSAPMPAFDRVLSSMDFSLRPAFNYAPWVEDYGELSFELIPFGLGTGAGCVITGRDGPMSGYNTALKVLVVAAQKCLRK